MKKSRFTESQIVAILKEGEAGVAVAQLTRNHGISAATYYHWKSKYGGADVSELKCLRELEGENVDGVNYLGRSASIILAGRRCGELRLRTESRRPFWKYCKSLGSPMNRL